MSADMDQLQRKWSCETWYVLHKENTESAASERDVSRFQKKLSTRSLCITLIGSVVLFGLLGRV